MTEYLKIIWEDLWLMYFFHRYCALSKEKVDLMNEELENGLPDHVKENRNKKKNNRIKLGHILRSNPKSLSDRSGHSRDVSIFALYW